MITRALPLIEAFQRARWAKVKQIRVGILAWLKHDSWQHCNGGYIGLAPSNPADVQSAVEAAYDALKTGLGGAQMDSNQRLM
jgi:hypothetical protein